MPLQQLMERIETEMHDNPALEQSVDEGYSDESYTPEPSDSTDGGDDYDSIREREERIDALDAALAILGRDDEDLPVYQDGRSSQEEHEEMVYGESLSFYDYLLEQVGEMELSDQERYVMEYLIRSLDDDGLLRASLDSICEELAIYHNIDLTTDQLQQTLRKLQRLDPAGIGGRDLQECLLLQIERRERSKVKDLMKKVVTHHFEEFTKKHWGKIQQSLGLDDRQTAVLMKELRRLNPKPGASMGETIGRSMQQITPDFIADTQDDGTVTFVLNEGDMPHLHVSQSFADLLKDYQKNKGGLTRQMKEALIYTKQKVEAAQNFIDAIQLRRQTLTLTMEAIINWQHRFFEEGDESLLKPMILKDIGNKTGLDLSTISRVSNSKYVQTRWGTFPLRYFFSDAYTTGSGEELSTREIKVALRDLIDGEDKRKPLSDEALSAAMKKKGYPIARRTVAKYREQMGYPVSRLRK
jgi:RNA polymerase sigma-54 factor